MLGGIHILDMGGLCLERSWAQLTAAASSYRAPGNAYMTSSSCVPCVMESALGRGYYRGRRNSSISRTSTRCKRSSSEDNGEDGERPSSSTATEEPEKNAPESPSTSSSQAPPPPKNVQLDAFRFMELVGPEKVDPEDVKLLKEKVFGYSTYWVTGQEPFGVVGEGVLLLGNLRGQREQVFEKLQRGVEDCGVANKYDLFMVEEPNTEEADPRGGPRVSFLLLRKEASNPGATTFWQYVIAAVLLVLTAGSCLQLGFATQLQVSKLPPEVIQYFTSPETTEPPDLNLLVPYVESALPLAYGVFGVHLFHELGHRLVAAPLNVKLGVPYFIPNITLGSFGSITQFKSLCPDRKAKFDISLAGPVAGGLLSFTMVAAGLWLSANGGSDAMLVQVPAVVFQGSFLLGLISKGVLGTVNSGTVSVHPLLIAGWCGVTATAFNLLPVGCIDGGRAFQAAFGNKRLNISGLITYLSLGLSLLGGPLSLPWGLYILITQRSPEKSCLNDVTGVGNWRRAAYSLALVLAILTLLPGWDGAADQLSTMGDLI